MQGESIPALGLGTWQMQGAECRKAVENALEIGYRHIDTAQAYGNEAQVGTAISNSGVDRDDIWLTTKIWRTNYRHDDVISSFHQSLEKLQTDYVDLLLIHWPHDAIPFEETLGAMAELVEGRNVRSIGISNFSASQIEEAIDVSQKKILTNQVEYHPFLDQSEILEKCHEKDMMLTAYSPIARGDVIGNETLKQIGERYDKSEAQVSLRWLIQQDNVSAIPKAASREHQEDNFDIFDFELSDEEVRQISDLAGDSRKVNPRFASWN